MAPTGKPAAVWPYFAIDIRQLFTRWLWTVVILVRIRVVLSSSIRGRTADVDDGFTTSPNGLPNRYSTNRESSDTIISITLGPGMDLPYWIVGTALPCTTLDECTYIVNGSDTFGGDETFRDISYLTEPCIISNHISIAKNWYGYIGRFRMRAHGAKFYYHITYAETDCCMKLLLYLEPQMEMLRYHMSCLQMQSVLDPTSPQVITLSPNSPSSGCKVNVTSSGSRIIDCFSGRILSSDIERNWYLAVSSCGSPDGLKFSYSLYIYGWVTSEPNYDNDCPMISYLAAGSRITAPASWIVASGLLVRIIIELRDS